MTQAYQKLTQHLEKANALQTAMLLFEWDNETLAPEQAGTYTAKIIGTLSQEYFECITSAEVKRLLEECQKENDLTANQQGILTELARELRELDCVPVEEYRRFAELAANSARIWAKAKKENDFQVFAPTLKEVVEYQKKFAGYRARNGEKRYDVMLNHYEEGFHMEHLDRFFDRLKEELVPFLKELLNTGRPPEDQFLTGHYSRKGQEQICRYLAEYVGFDFSKGVMAVSAHPFTTNLHNHDVRITTHYDNNLSHSVFSVIHEAGHGIYEQGISDDLTQTLAGQGLSMGMHESQSRFFENILGRNAAFWTPLYPKLQELFPEQLGGVTKDQFVRAINQVTPGLIRIEADELTYSLHIMIRYELEKALIEQDLPVDQLPQLWADKYEEYLGLRPSEDQEGVLQDIHWAQGYFGYFPSYALGSAFGAQMYAHMKKQMNMEELMEQGTIQPITSYLKEHIHRHGKLKTSRMMLEQMTGEQFNADYYIQYLKEKYQKYYFE